MLAIGVFTKGGPVLRSGDHGGPTVQDGDAFIYVYDYTFNLSIDKNSLKVSGAIGDEDVRGHARLTRGGRSYWITICDMPWVWCEIFFE
jgi:hypothetical protein